MNSTMSLINDVKCIVATFIGYFSNIFKFDASVDLSFISSIVNFGSLAKAEDNEAVTTEVTDFKIRKALFSLVPNKSSGPNGYSMDFFQKS